MLAPLDLGTSIPLWSGIDFYQNLSFRRRKTFTFQDAPRCRLLLVAIHFCAQAWWLSYVAFATLRRNRCFSILPSQKSMKNRLGAGRGCLGRLWFHSGVLLGVFVGLLCGCWGSFVPIRRHTRCLSWSRKARVCQRSFIHVIFFGFLRF